MTRPPERGDSRQGAIEDEGGDAILGGIAWLQEIELDPDRGAGGIQLYPGPGSAEQRNGDSSDGRA